MVIEKALVVAQTLVPNSSGEERTCNDIYLRPIPSTVLRLLNGVNISVQTVSAATMARISVTVEEDCHNLAGLCERMTRAPTVDERMKCRDEFLGEAKRHMASVESVLFPSIQSCEAIGFQAIVKNQQEYRNVSS
jgi:hypothetical protein